jgi:copper chaperone NosL
MLGVAALLAACQPTASGEPRPPEINYGHDLCDACGMLIDQPQFAAATLTLDGDTFKFDAIADMVEYHAEHPTQQVRAWFVHDYNSQAWTRAESAYFVHSQAIKSPMGHGVAAFIAEADAQALAAELDAAVISFDVLRAELAEGAHHAH